MASDNDDHTPLNYATPPGGDDVHTSARAGWIILGLGTGALGTILAGCAGLAAFGNQESTTLRIVMVSTMIALSLACWARLTWGTRTGRTRWFLMGLLIGAGIMSLIEGYCFAVIS